MSTVLWTNLLVGSEVTSDQVDRYALYRHGEKLDRLCRDLGLPPFLDLCDTTDQRYNVEGWELPDGMTSTNQLMVRDGVWMERPRTIAVLQQLVAHIREQRVRFGLFSNDHDAVVTELTEVIAWLEAGGDAAKCNFSVVM